MTTARPYVSSLRRMSLLDSLLTEANRSLQVLANVAHASRPNPADAAPRALTYSGTTKPDTTASNTSATSGMVNTSEAPPPAPALPAPVMASASAEPGPADVRHSRGLMRVNHVGEICAQALYRGQAVGTIDPRTRALFLKAAEEEVDHLVWLNQRLRELEGRTSLLNPLWYAGSFFLGWAASRAGESFNLGFMAETEKQVTAHLENHLRKLPASDVRSRRILEQMKIDEANHQKTAEHSGATELPLPVRAAMRAMSKVMTTTAYWI